MLPEIPSWDAVHPFAAHSPIGVLPIAPLFVVLGFFSQRQRRAYWIAALLLMVLGTLGAALSASSGEAAAQTVRATQGIQHAWEVLQQHEQLAEVATAIFGVLTLVYATMIIGPWWVERRFKKTVPPVYVLIANVVFLAIFSGAYLLLLHAGHEGGRLVYELGVRTVWPPAQGY